jgi:hypothetical protein
MCPSTVCTYSHPQEYLSQWTISNLYMPQLTMHTVTMQPWISVNCATCSRWCPVLIGVLSCWSNVIFAVLWSAFSCTPSVTFMLDSNSHFFTGSHGYHQRDRDWSLIAYYSVWTLRNLAVHGGNSGRQAVLDATTDDLRQILPHISDGVRKFWGDELAATTPDDIAATWP